MDYELYLLLIFIISSLNCLGLICIGFYLLINNMNLSKEKPIAQNLQNLNTTVTPASDKFDSSAFILRDDEDLAEAEELNRKGRIPYG
jgi:hypothetical protein